MQNMEDAATAGEDISRMVYAKCYGRLARRSIMKLIKRIAGCLLRLKKYPVVVPGWERTTPMKCASYVDREVKAGIMKSGIGAYGGIRVIGTGKNSSRKGVGFFFGLVWW